MGFTYVFKYVFVAHDNTSNGLHEISAWISDISAASDKDVNGNGYIHSSCPVFNVTWSSMNLLTNDSGRNAQRVAFEITFILPNIYMTHYETVCCWWDTSQVKSTSQTNRILYNYNFNN